MIFARDKSQMCNNLLQFAHVYAWAREHNRSVMSMRFSYKYPFFKITKSRHSSFAMYLFAKYMAAIHLLPTASFKHEDCDREALEQMMQRHRHIVVSGWFVRYYDLFLKYRAEICDLFTINRDITTPVEEAMKQCEEGEDNIVRLGVHIRRGDYAEWKGGIYCYTDQRYAAFITAFQKLLPKKNIHVYLSSNDPNVSEQQYQRLVDTHAPQSNITIHNLRGSATADLYMLSQCDYIIGPPSTFSLVATMYRDIPLCRMDTTEPQDINTNSFKNFDYWFRRIV